MAIAPHRGLRVVLGSMSLLAAVVGLLMIFGGKLLVTKLFMHPPESEISTLLLFTMKEVGGFAFMLSFMLFFAYRDPVRNVAIIDSLIVGLCVLALTPLLSMYTPDIRRLYPGYLIWGRSLGRLVLAALFFYFRPREAAGRRSWE